MVSKIVGLSLLAALASTVNAYSWYAQMVAGPGGRKFTIHPVDPQIPGNDQALVWETQWGSPTVKPPFVQYGYENIETELHTAGELVSLIVLSANPWIRFNCQKIEEFQEPSTTTWRVYSCTNPAFNGKKGIPVPAQTPTTTAAPVVTTTVDPVVTTTCPVVTITVPVTVTVTVTTTALPPTTTDLPTTTVLPPTTTVLPPTTTELPPTTTVLPPTTTVLPPTTTVLPPTTTNLPPSPTTTSPQPSPTCLAGYRGKRNGKGPNGACCSHSDDCKDTCVKGVCGVHP